MLLFWWKLGGTAEWLDLLAIIFVPASLRLSGRLSDQAPLDARTALVSVALVSMWLWVTRWTTLHGVPGHLTTAWTILSVTIFAAGLGLRERVYRLGGIGILGLAVGHLFVVDVWRFDSLARILSFMVLGCALLGVSFIYHRFADAMRKYL
jgi:hypothetical protein